MPKKEFPNIQCAGGALGSVSALELGRTLAFVTTPMIYIFALLVAVKSHPFSCQRQNTLEVAPLASCKLPFFCSCIRARIVKTDSISPKGLKLHQKKCQSFLKREAAANECRKSTAASKNFRRTKLKERKVRMGSAVRFLQ